MSGQAALKFIAGEKPFFNMDYAILSAPVRHLFMMGSIWYLTREQKIENLRVLEIGSWLGASALSFAQGLQLYNDSKGILTCVDAWKPFFNRDTHTNEVYIKMEEALSFETAYQIFSHNISTVPASITCQHLRGNSENVLPILRENSFDIVFIDGDHAYTPVLKDINNSLALVREGGIICGDDLNLQLSQVNKANTQAHAESDFIKDPTTNRNYHPGVTLAVAEIFGEVSSWGGFWAMQKRGGNWHKISLKGMPIHYPDHFPQSARARAEDHLRDIEIT